MAKAVDRLRIQLRQSRRPARARKVISLPRRCAALRGGDGSRRAVDPHPPCLRPRPSRLPFFLCPGAPLPLRREEREGSQSSAARSLDPRLYRSNARGERIGEGFVGGHAVGGLRIRQHPVTEDSSCSPCSPRWPATGTSGCHESSARHLFDGMLEMAAASDSDPFGDLSDELLWRVLSFLPAEDALQTCVLDTRWRDLWRRLTSLLFVFDGPTFPRYKRFEQLVKLVICLRGNSPLVRCEIDAYPDDEPEDMFTGTRLLIDYAIACEAEELIVRAADVQYDLPMFNVPLSLISKHLKTLHLEGVNLDHSALKFSGCPVLEDLRIQLCNIRACEISSMSLKCLCITDYCSLPDNVRLRICAPSLISLQLDDFEGLTPFLENMPLLETAYVRLNDGCHDFCRKNKRNCDTPWCGCHAYPVNEGVLLNGLSNAVKLDLIALPKMFLYRWDLKWCPIFGKLKTLLLNEWFMAVDLVCILRQSPVLEILTLKLDNTEKIAGATGAQETKTQSFVCACLKSVYVECEEVDEGVLAILNILSTCGILREQISIKEDPHTELYYSSADSDSTDSD